MLTYERFWHILAALRDEAINLQQRKQQNNYLMEAIKT